MLRRSIGFLQSGEKLPISPDIQIVQCKNFEVPLNSGNEITLQTALTMRIGVAKGPLRQV